MYERESDLPLLNPDMYLTIWVNWTVLLLNANALVSGEEKMYNCIPESFNTNILHQLFDYKIIFAN